MSVSKRTRFEILRRDEHTCQYCGHKAPDVTLHVDHIIPVALGGDDKPSNLVTACVDCNQGKTSISPDSPIVSAISSRSAEYALANLNRAARIESEMEAMEQYEEEFLADWESYTYKDGTKISLPSDWRNSMKAWWKISVPKSLITSATQTAMGAKNVTGDGVFPYFAGVVWRTLDEFDMRYAGQNNEGRVYTSTELETLLSEKHDEAYVAGIEDASLDSAADVSTTQRKLLWILARGLVSSK